MADDEAEFDFVVEFYAAGADAGARGGGEDGGGGFEEEEGLGGPRGGEFGYVVAGLGRGVSMYVCMYLWVWLWEGMCLIRRGREGRGWEIAMAMGTCFERGPEG